MKRSLAFVLLISPALAMLLGSCQRSPAYRQDQEFSDAMPPSYYSGDGKPKTSSQKFESMGQPKKRVIVFNFWNDTPVKEGDLGNFCADQLKGGLFKTQRMIIPTDAPVELNTEDYIQGEQVRVAQLIREGRRLGVAVLVIGRISKIVFRQRGDEVGLFRQKQTLAAADLEIKIFDVAAGREVMALQRSGEATSNAIVALEDNNLQSTQYRTELTKTAIRNAAIQLVPDVVKSIEKMNWQGRIAKISGTKVYVNAGHASGLQHGDILKVLTPGDDVYDPATGAFLGHSQGQLKGTLEVTDFLGTDGAVTEVHTGGNFQEGDSVQLY